MLNTTSLIDGLPPYVANVYASPSWAILVLRRSRDIFIFVGETVCEDQNRKDPPHLSINGGLNSDDSWGGDWLKCLQR